MTKLLIAIAGFSLLFQSVNAQDTNQVKSELQMVTNRPGFTEAAKAVYKSGFQIETGFQFSKSPNSKNSDSYTNNFLLPNLGLLYGVSKNVEIRAFIDYQYSKNVVDSSLEGMEYYKELSGFYLGSKINLTNQDGYLPEMAVLITQGIPTSSINAKVWSTKALLAWSYSLPKNFGLSGNLTYAREYVFEESVSLANPDVLGYTFNLGYSINYAFGCYAELFGNNNLGIGESLDVNITGGFWHRLNNNFQVDLIGGYDFETGGYLVNAGFSLLLIK
jgi:hypothetical protein